MTGKKEQLECIFNLLIFGGIPGTCKLIPVTIGLCFLRQQGDFPCDSEAVPMKDFK